MGHFLCVGAGFFAGLIGAAVWAAISYFAHAEIGWIAWGIGALVGVGVAMGSRGNQGMATGVIAGVIALASVAVGKYAAVSFTVSKVLAQSPVTMNDEQVQVYIADKLVGEAQGKNQTLKWPAGKSFENAEHPSDYPPEIWKDSQARWNAMSETDKTNFRKSAIDDVAFNRDQVSEIVTNQGFKASFGLFDILWTFLAFMTAYRIGSGGNN